MIVPVLHMKTIVYVPPPHTHTHQPPSMHSSRIYPVRRSTVVVHGEVLVIRKLVVAGIVSAEKNYLECLSVMKEVGCVYNRS